MLCNVRENVGIEENMYGNITLLLTPIRIHTHIVICLCRKMLLFLNIPFENWMLTKMYNTFIRFYVETLVKFIGLVCTQF